MKTKWLLETEMFWDDNPDVLSPAIKQLDMEVKYVKYHPFETSVYEEFYNPNDCVIAYGSINFILKIMREKQWIPCTWYDSLNWKCSTYYAYYTKHLLNHHHAFYPWSSFLYQKDRPGFVSKCFDSIGELSDYVFIRPDSGNKEFTGCVISIGNAEKDLAKMSYGLLEPTCMVVIAPVREILQEYRFFIAQGEVVSCCRYKLNNKHEESVNVPDGAIQKATEIAKESWQPSSVYVMDIAYAYEKYWLMEINSFNSAGFYSCDPLKIIGKVSEIALKEWEDINV